jgi:CelD/BcsL family acetyltransferase involved in cellulose biosynthesis
MTWVGGKATSAPWSFEWITSWDEVWGDASLTRWRRLFDEQPPVGYRTPFFHLSFVRAWYEAHGGTKGLRPYFLLARSSSGQEVLFPLVCAVTRWKHGWIRRLKPIGEKYADYHDPIVSGPASGRGNLDTGFWDGFVRELDRRAGAWFDDFGFVRVQEPCCDDSERWISGDVSPYLDISAYSDFEAFMRSRTKSLRGDVKRQIARLGTLGQVEYREYFGGDLLNVGWASRLEAARGLRYPTAQFPKDFLQSLIRTGSTGGPAHFSSLSVGGREVSWQVGFQVNPVYYWWVPGFDREFASYSPGKIHIYYAIRSAFMNGCIRFDFMRGDEAYKFAWTDSEETRNYRFSLASSHPFSHVRRRLAHETNKLGYLASHLRRARGGF